MASFGPRLSRRSLLMAGLTAPALLPQGRKGAAFPGEALRYSDPTTEFEVYRLTDPAHASILPAYYNRAIARNGGSMLFCSDRAGAPQAFRMDFKSGGSRQLTEAQDLDGSSLTLTPDNRSFCYFAGRSLCIAGYSSLRERELYRIPEGWGRAAGMSVGPDGTHATFAERRDQSTRLRMVSLIQGAARTVVDMPFAFTDPIPRPMRAQILFRQGEEALWLVNSDGSQKRQLKLAPGRVGPANWADDGKTLLYLNFPEDSKELNAIRECTPDTGTDRLVSKTSQYAHFGFNHDTSVFVGASRNVASPAVLILLRATRRELTVCEHKSSQPAAVAPRFSPDSQRICFQSDRDGKPAIYWVHVETLVEKTEAES